MPAGTSPRAITTAMIDGEIYKPIVAKITIPEGFTLAQVAARLEANGIGAATETIKLATGSELLQKLGIKSDSLEGFLYPATYEFFVKLPTPEEALSAMVEKFWKMLPVNYPASASALGLDLKQAVTFASLIELETGQESEKKLVSEVIWRRLRANDFLGIDAAIIYGITGYQGDLTWKHLRDPANPYNTRLHRGLPPSPIGSPSRTSLEAVLAPTDFGYYYYVLDADNPGTHHFSKTGAEHALYVRKLVKTTPEKKSSSPSSRLGSQ